MNQKLGFPCFRGIHNSLPSFWVKLGYYRTIIDHKVYYFIADSLLKDSVLMVGVNLRLCLLSLCYQPVAYLLQWTRSWSTSLKKGNGTVVDSTFSQFFFSTRTWNSPAQLNIPNLTCERWSKGISITTWWSYISLQETKKAGKEVTFSTFFVSRVCLTRVQSQCRDSGRSENLGGQKSLFIYVMCTTENPGRILKFTEP